MDFLLTMVRSELGVSGRGRRFYLRRMLLVAGFATPLAFAVMAGASGLTLFGLALMPVLMLATVFAPLVAVDALTRERQQRVLGLLMLSDIRPWELILGKVASHLIASLTTMLCVLPLLCLGVALGGVGLPQLLAGCLLLASTVFAGTCLGLTVGALVTNRQRGTFYALAAAVLYFHMVPWLITEYVAWPDLSVWRMGMAIIDDSRRLDLLTIAGCHLYTGLACIGLLRLLPQALTGEFHSRPAKAPSRMRPSASPTIRQAITGNPIAWRDLTCRYGSSGRGLLIALALAVSISVYFFGHELLEYGYQPWRRSSYIMGASWMIIWPLGILAVVLTFWRCCNAFSDEKDNHLTELLLLTDLEPKEIVAGKLQAIWRPLRPLLLTLGGLILLNLVLFARGDDAFEVIIVGILVAYGIGYWYAITGIALACGYRRKHRVVLNAIGLSIMLHIACSFALPLFGMLMAFVGWLVTALVAIAGGSDVGDFEDNLFTLAIVLPLVGAVALAVPLAVGQMFRRSVAHRLANRVLPPD